MNRLVAFAVIAMTAIFASACSDDSGATGPSTASRLEGTWLLAAFELASGSVETVDDPQSYTIEFSSEGQLGMLADCNRCSSSYEAQGVELSVGGLACTRAACPPESKSDEFIRAVSDSTSYLRQDETLFLYYPGGRLRLQRN